MVTEWFPLAWKSIDTSQNEESIEKYVYTKQKKSYLEYLKNGKKLGVH